MHLLLSFATIIGEGRLQHVGSFYCSAYCTHMFGSTVAYKSYIAELYASMLCYLGCTVVSTTARAWNEQNLVTLSDCMLGPAKDI